MSDLRPTIQDIFLDEEERVLKAHSDDPIQKYEWQARLAIRPHICVLSRMRIPMFTYAYKGTRKIYGLAGEPPVILHKWLTSAEYLILKLKGSL